MTTRILRPSLAKKAHQYYAISISQPQRPFVSNPFDFFTAPQTLTAARTLSYPCLDVYDIIADIESYPKFLPYCLLASVKSWSAEDAIHHRTWPAVAELTTGWGEIRERFTSGIVCVPPTAVQGWGIVEAISGETRSAVRPEDAPHYHVAVGEPPKTGWNVTSMPGGAPLQYLRTKWTVRRLPETSTDTDVSNPQRMGVNAARLEGKEKTDVKFEIEYKFSNVVYETMSKALAPQLAEKMIAAFERRVGSLLGMHKKRLVQHR